MSDHFDHDRHAVGASGSGALEISRDALAPDARWSETRSRSSRGERLSASGGRGGWKRAQREPARYDAQGVE
jgi:hypothetical protein